MVWCYHGYANAFVIVTSTITCKYVEFNEVYTRDSFGSEVLANIFASAFRISPRILSCFESDQYGLMIFETFHTSLQEYILNCETYNEKLVDSKHKHIQESIDFMSFKMKIKHNDLAPRNILFHPQTGKIKIIDFHHLVWNSGTDSKSAIQRIVRSIQNLKKERKRVSLLASVM